MLCRPPHGGRGLKSAIINDEVFGVLRSSSTRGTWIEMLTVEEIEDQHDVVLHTGDVD